MGGGGEITKSLVLFLLLLFANFKGKQTRIEAKCLSNCKVGVSSLEGSTQIIELWSLGPGSFTRTTPTAAAHYLKRRRKNKKTFIKFCLGILSQSKVVES